MEELIKKAGILVEALPYIQKFAGITIVIKYGGNAMISEELKNSVMQDVTLLKYIGLNPIIVHGGAPDITEALKVYNIESQFVGGLRVTDEETMKVAQMVLIGKTNKEIVSKLCQHGGNAVGLSGIDANLIQCEKQILTVDGKEVDLGYVGEVVNVNTKILQDLTKNGYIPVIAPIGVGENGESYNINADTVAAAVAKALRAEKLMFLTDTEGVRDENGDIIFEMNKDRAADLIEDGVINGGMLPKVKACIKAINAGVRSVHIIDGRIPHCLLLEIFTHTGIGTMITSL
ncbi:MAG: acetylglutamate kinase [Clostridiaceae bacterium]|nr:acetylglutamate kinase [Clostridiaceae bacterium]